MEMLRLIVTPHGKGYLAVSREPNITALGSSPVEAAENGRLAALALVAKALRPTQLLVRVNEPGLCTIVMQPIDKPFSIANDDQPKWRYIASAQNDWHQQNLTGA